jgi:uncharacterized protein YndB with AHSA1/START domain
MIEPTSQSVSRERTLSCPPASVWRALIEPNLISQWLYENDFRPIVGNRFQFRGKPRPHWNGLVDGEVLCVEPERKLSYTWTTVPNADGRSLETIVTWTLAPTRGYTHVRVEQSGFRSEEEARGPSLGWDRLLSSLESVVAQLSGGAAVDPRSGSRS